MNNDNIVKIGTALKWRNTFDITKKYYQENVVTVCGCVFRCKVLQAQGKSPVTITDNQGHIVYTNTDVWDVLVDMAYYYNFTVDTKKLTQETLDYVKQLDKAIKKQQEEIHAIQEDDKKQWEHINAIEKTNEEQQREIDSVLDTISCFSEGIWIDTLLWNNEDLWIDNPNGLVEIETEVIEHNDRITVLEAQFASFMQQFTAQQSIISQQQAQLETLMDCFTVLNVGKWQNLLLWDNTSKWSDALITEVAGDSGVASVAVKSYDPETATVSI